MEQLRSWICNTYFIIMYAYDCNLRVFIFFTVTLSTIITLCAIIKLCSDIGYFAFIVIARLLRVILMPHAPASEPV